MKQVSYEFDWMQMLGAVVNSYIPEDGFWRLEISTETLTGNFDGIYEGQRPGIVPGQTIRMLGTRVTQVPGRGPLTVERRNGEIFHATDTSQHGSNESSGSSGEDSGESRETYPTPIASGF